MKLTSNGFISSFLDSAGQVMIVDKDNAVFTAACRNDMATGGHAACFLEYQSNENVASMYKYDIVSPGGGKIQLRKMEVQDFQLDIKGYDNDQVNAFLKHINTMKYHSYRITRVQANAVMDSIKRFQKKIETKRYVYSQPGGVLGSIFSTIGHRGINCADFVIKIINDAGIAHVNNKLYNTPRFAAGSSNR